MIKIGLTIGTTYTSIFLDGQGVVLREPSVIAFVGDPRHKRIRAVGRKAQGMSGKTPDKTTVVRPLQEGVIVDKDAAVLMLREFLKKIISETTIFAPRIKAILGIPCGISVEERLIYEDVCARAGIGDLTLIESIIPAALGAGLNIEHARGSIIADIGGGTTEIAVMSLCGMVAGCSVNKGGINMDSEIKSYIGAKYNIKISLSAAEKLKIGIGTLFDNDIATMQVSGTDVETKSPAQVTIKASDTLEAVIPIYHSVCDAIISIINICPPDISADLYHSGIVFSGGAAQIPGLYELARTRLQLPVAIAADPVNCTIVGLGKLLNAPTLLEEIFSQS